MVNLKCIFKNENIGIALGYAEGECGDDGYAWWFYYGIHNTSNEKLTLNLKETRLFSGTTIRERNYYVTGHLLTKFELLPNTNQIGADIYLEKNTNFDEGDKFFIKLEDLTNAEEYNLFFEMVDYENETFECVSSEINKNPILNPKIFETKLKNSMERLENLEDQIGMEIENLSVKLDGNELKILGDLFVSNPEQYHSITLNANFYDKDNNMIDTSECSIYLKDFLGVESFKISRYFSNPSEVGKIRLYPSIDRR